MEAPTPPPAPMSPTTMDSLARVDLTALHSDAVLVYANRVAQLQATKTNSPEKLQMLFVLAQKLVRWFLDERREMERLNNVLEETLLEALATSVIPPSPSVEAESSPQTEETPVEASTDTNSVASPPKAAEVIPTELVDCGVQVEIDIDHATARSEIDPCSSCPAETQTDPDVAVCVDRSTQSEGFSSSMVDGCVQTDASALKSTDMEAQTEIAPVCVDASAQAEAVTNEESIQTDADTERCFVETQTDCFAGVGVECGVQVQSLVEDGSVQTDVVADQLVAETQTDAAPEATDCSVQAEPSLCDDCAQTNPSAEQCVVETQTNDAVSTVECSVQVEDSTAEGIVQTHACAGNCVAETQTVGVEAVECSVQVQAVSVESEVQTTPSAELLDSSCQVETVVSEALTQTEPAPSVAECEVQVHLRTPAVEESCQTDLAPQSVDSTVQTQLETASTCVQTPILEFNDSEMQTTAVMIDHDTSTREDFDSADFSVQASDADWIVVTPSSTTAPVPPIDVYFQVHRSIVRLQRVVRGHMTRRRFYRMLNELVNAK